MQLYLQFFFYNFTKNFESIIIVLFFLIITFFKRSTSLFCVCVREIKNSKLIFIDFIYFMMRFLINFLFERMIFMNKIFLMIHAAIFFKICKFFVFSKVVVIKYDIIKSMKQIIINKIRMNFDIIVEKPVQFICNF